MITLLRRGRGRRVFVALAAVITVLISGGVALAYWSANGQGTGSATTGTMTFNVTAFNAGDANGTTLVLGGTADVILRVNNPNTFSVHVTSIGANGSVTASNNCTPTGVTFVAPSDYSAGQFTLAPGSSLLDLQGAVSMSTSSASACQGATFNIPVAVTVQR